MTRRQLVSVLRDRSGPYLAVLAVLVVSVLGSVLRRPTPAPAPLGEEFQVNTLMERIQQSSSVALAAHGDCVVAWQSEVAGLGDEIRAQRYDARGVAQGGEIEVNTLKARNQNVPAVAVDAHGSFVIVWQSLIANNFEIRARRFDAHGVAPSDEIAVNLATGDAHSAPRVAIDAAGNFVVVWESSVNGSYEIRARRFAKTGAAQGGEIAVNAVTLSSQRAPAVAMSAAGDFVVVWRSNVDGRFEIVARRFDAHGIAQSGDLAVRAATTGDGFVPTVAMAAAGDFVVAWESSREAGSSEIRARRFDAHGAGQGAELAVDPELPSAVDQLAPAVAMAADGDFVVAWHRRARGGSELRARAFAASGAAQGAAFTVSTVTVGTQKSAAVALAATGDFVVTWHSDATGSWEIGARRYRHAPRAFELGGVVQWPRLW